MMLSPACLSPGFSTTDFCRGRLLLRASSLVLLLLTPGIALLAAAPLGKTEQNREEIAIKAAIILRNRCSSCHGAEKQEGSLRLDSWEASLQGGDHGPAIDAQSLTTSPLLTRVESNDADLQMPPKNPLSADEKTMLRDWLEQGATWHAESWSEDNGSHPNQNDDKLGDAWSDPRNPIRKLWGGDRLDLWSLRPLHSPPLPRILDREWPVNAIDYFVLAKYEAEGKKPLASADRRTLLRRLSYDLTGLPPTDISRPIGDEEALTRQEYEQYVDRWLASPAYGEHWGRMWLDVVRYSDSNGFDWDEFRPQAWKFRDYVIGAFNRDLPYDEFITQQLAGDELVPAAPRDESERDSLIATGYLRLGPHDNAAALFDEQDRSRAELLADLTETTGSAFLAMTLSCCRCHDHKTDPLSQADHYRLRAFFSQLQFDEGRPLDLSEQAAEIDQHNQVIDQRVEILRAKLAQGRITEEKHKKEVAHLNEQRRTYETGLLVKEETEKPAATYIFYQGDHKAQRGEVQPGFPSILDPNPAKIASPSHGKTTGRRLQLARWLTSKENRLTARVIVNRLWQAHFGVGLVPTPNDFGVSGTPPTHPELLDWLAVELIESDWSIKHIQRLIVTSKTYQQRMLSHVSQPDSATGSSEKGSMRTSVRRLSAEQIRDSMLQVSGLLDRRMGGAPVWPELPAEILQANPAFLDDNETKTKGWYPSPLSQQQVRSIYWVQKRTVRIPFMEIFDLPENSVSCARRDVAIVAPQALSMLNSEIAILASESLAERIKRSMPANVHDEERVAALFQLVLQRKPLSSETEQCIRFLETHALADLCRALLNTNEFVFIE